MTLFDNITHKKEKDQHGQKILDANRKSFGKQAKTIIMLLLENGFVIYEDARRNHGVGYPNSRVSDLKKYFDKVGYDWDSMIKRETVNFEGSSCTKISMDGMQRGVLENYLKLNKVI